MPTLLNIVLRLAVVLAGLVLTASLAVLVLLGFAAWALHSAWGRLLGRPVRRFQVPARAKGSFRFSTQRGSLRPRHADVTDVRVKSGS
jgi:hypothetical protein